MRHTVKTSYSGRVFHVSDVSGRDSYLAIEAIVPDSNNHGLPGTFLTPDEAEELATYLMYYAKRVRDKKERE